jgi:hypothetical protein
MKILLAPAHWSMSGQPIDKINNYFFDAKRTFSKHFAGESDDLRTRPDAHDYPRTSAGNLKASAAILQCEADVMALRLVYKKPHLWCRAWVITNLVSKEEMEVMTGCVLDTTLDLKYKWEASHKCSAQIIHSKGPSMLCDIPSIHSQPLTLGPPGQKKNEVIFAAPTALHWAPPHDTEVMHAWKIIDSTGGIAELHPETRLDPYVYFFYYDLMLLTFVHKLFLIPYPPSNIFSSTIPRFVPRRLKIHLFPGIGSPS